MHNIDESTGYRSGCLSSGNWYHLQFIWSTEKQRIRPFSQVDANMMGYSTLFTLWTTLCTSLFYLTYSLDPWAFLWWCLAGRTSASVFRASIFIEHPLQQMKKVQKINLTMNWSQEMTSMASAEGLKQQIHEFSLFSLSSVGYKLLPAKVFDKSILCFSTSKWPWHASSVSMNESLVLFQCWNCFMIKQWNAFGCWGHLWWVLWWVFCLLFNPKRNNEPLASKEEL